MTCPLLPAAAPPTRHASVLAMTRSFLLTLSTYALAGNATPETHHLRSATLRFHDFQRARQSPNRLNIFLVAIKILFLAKKLFQRLVSRQIIFKTGEPLRGLILKAFINLPAFMPQHSVRSAPDPALPNHKDTATEVARCSLTAFYPSIEQYSLRKEQFSIFPSRAATARLRKNAAIGNRSRIGGNNIHPSGNPLQLFSANFMTPAKSNTTR